MRQARFSVGDGIFKKQLIFKGDFTLFLMYIAKPLIKYLSRIFGILV